MGISKKESCIAKKGDSFSHSQHPPKKKKIKKAMA